MRSASSWFASVGYANTQLFGWEKDIYFMHFVLLTVVPHLGDQDSAQVDPLPSTHQTKGSDFWNEGGPHYTFSKLSFYSVQWNHTFISSPTWKAFIQFLSSWVVLLYCILLFLSLLSFSNFLFSMEWIGLSLYNPSKKIHEDPIIVFAFMHSILKSLVLLLECQHI